MPESTRSSCRSASAALLLRGVPVLVVCAGALAQEAGPSGRDLAFRHCAVCHVIGDYNRFGGIDSTPSFQLLANMDDGPERFRSFFARRPHQSFVHLPDRSPPTDLPLNAPRVDLTYDQLDALVDFALTFRAPGSGSSP